MNIDERRSYQRSNHFHAVAKISRDGNRWMEVHINDLSAGGIQIRTDERFTVKEIIWLDLIIQGFYSEFEVKVQGSIRWEKLFEGHHIYGIAFKGLSPDLQIRIDENVKNDRPLGGNPYHND